jgi:hypothetical protein
MGEIVKFPGRANEGDDFLVSLEMVVLRTLLSGEGRVDEVFDRAQGLCLARQLYLQAHPGLIAERDAEIFLATLVGRLATLTTRERMLLRHPSCNHERMTKMLNGDPWHR